MSDEKNKKPSIEEAITALGGVQWQSWMHPDWKPKDGDLPYIDVDFTVVAGVETFLNPPPTLEITDTSPVDAHGQKPLFYVPDGKGGVEFVYPEPPKPKGRVI